MRPRSSWRDATLPWWRGEFNSPWPLHVPQVSVVVSAHWLENPEGSVRLRGGTPTTGNSTGRARYTAHMSQPSAEMKYLIKRRQRAKARLGGVCVVCGTDQNLEFDHVDPSSKVIEVSRAIALHWTWEKLVAEIDKCQLLCREHHVEKSKVDGSSRGGGWNKIDNPKHGTSVMYLGGCRCEACREWKRLYRHGFVDARGKRLKEGDPPGRRRRLVAEHGTRPKYRNGCRCGPCTEANAAYMRELRGRKKSSG